MRAGSGALGETEADRRPSLGRRQRQELAASQRVPTSASGRPASRARKPLRIYGVDDVGAWQLDGAVELGIAGWALIERRRAWRG
jgi:hypothetical protein